MEKRSEEGYEEKRGEREREREKVEKKKGAGEKPEKEAVWTRPTDPALPLLACSRNEAKKPWIKKLRCQGEAESRTGDRDQETKRRRRREVMGRRCEVCV